MAGKQHKGHAALYLPIGSLNANALRNFELASQFTSLRASQFTPVEFLKHKACDLDVNTQKVTTVTFWGDLKVKEKRKKTQK